ncbi:uncharacterized protein EHS24_003935 [Apiotrichum porosum]|uniref:Uncharacterized protein n=1 Tax=Apiotrichum porosum TaxID=105984 RepID=A0A427XE55_9TREE|nr:uncharacterized protein EHS24_003935 [Apiotrichum porosum]RSH76994.1 hypothetical protein EHS24_003935 [Apiotrichum porosum]
MRQAILRPLRTIGARSMGVPTRLFASTTVASKDRKTAAAKDKSTKGYDFDKMATQGPEDTALPTESTGGGMYSARSEANAMGSYESRDEQEDIDLDEKLSQQAKVKADARHKAEKSKSKPKK